MSNIVTLRSLLNNQNIIYSSSEEPNWQEILGKAEEAREKDFIIVIFAGYERMHRILESNDTFNWLDPITDPEISKRGLVGMFLGFPILSDYDKEDRFISTDMIYVVKLSSTPAIEAFLEGKAIYGSERTPSYSTFGIAMRLIIKDESPEYQQRLQDYLNAFEG